MKWQNRFSGKNKIWFYLFIYLFIYFILFYFILFYFILFFKLSSAEFFTQNAKS